MLPGMRHWPAVMATGLMWGCASAPAPAPEAPPAPAAPDFPMPKDQYLQGFVHVEVETVFSGAAALQAGLQWLVGGSIHNRGNRAISWLEAEFTVNPKGGSFRHIVIDPLSGQDGVDPNDSRGFTLPVCPLDQGLAGDYDPADKEWPPPAVTVRVVDMKFADEPQ